MKDENSGLEFDGERPNGTLTIYKDGSILVNSRFDDGSTYIKLPNETIFEKDDKSIGSYEDWHTNGEGKITMYLNRNEKALFGTKNFLDYLIFAYNYGVQDKTDSKSLPELIKEKEQSGEFSKLYLTETLKKEIDIAIGYMNVKEALTQSQMQSLIPVYQTTAPNVLDVFLNESTYRDDYDKYVAYEEIYNSLPEDTYKDYLVIPNYVRHKDGTLEPITIISETAFFRGEDSPKPCVFSRGNTIDTLEGGSVIIPEGIKELEASAFSFCGLNSISFPTTLELLGSSSLMFNKLNKIFLPASLKKIDLGAFAISGIKGDLLIPKSVQSIGIGAFIFTNEYKDFDNNITKVVFEKDSVIETIGESAFNGNPITELVLPSSIKTVDNLAFYTKTLKSVIIERAEGDDLSIGVDAFANATIEYRP